MIEHIRNEIVDFIVTTFLFGDAAALPDHNNSLIQTGVIDSTGVLELIEFLESRFSMGVSEEETVPANLDTVTRLTAYVDRKTRIGAAAS